MGGYFRSSLHGERRSISVIILLNLFPRVCEERKNGSQAVSLCRRDLNHPPTAVVGIFGLFTQSRQWVDRYVQPTRTDTWATVVILSLQCGKDNVMPV